MPVQVPPDTPLTSLHGQTAGIAEWTTTFSLVLVVVDPFTYESSWILDTAVRVLDTFADADCRTAFVVTGKERHALQFLGPHARRFLVFCDPDYVAVRAMGIERLPAFVFVDQAHTVEKAAEGWDPDEWRDVADHLAKVLRWTRPVLPSPKDPPPFEGSPLPEHASTS